MLRRARRQLLAGLKRAGVFDAVANSGWRRRRLLILCYHGVSIADEHEWNRQLYIPGTLLRARLDILRSGGYIVLPLAEALSRLRAGSLPPRSVAITFDDGAHDFRASAFPLLVGYGFPTTVYLTTYYCERQHPVFDTALSYMLWRSGRPAVDIGGLVPGIATLDLANELRRREAALAVRESVNLSGLSATEKDGLLRRVGERLGLDYDAVFSNRLLYLMTPDEVRDVAAAGVDIQLHTHRHRTPADRAAFLREIDDNRASIARIVDGRRRTHFCYPSGVYTPSSVEWLREAGVESATTCDFRLASSRDEMLLLPRLVDTCNISPVEFEACLTGVSALLPHRRRAHAQPEAAACRSDTRCQQTGA